MFDLTTQIEHFGVQFVADLPEASGYEDLRIRLYRLEEEDEKIWQYIDNIEVNLVDSAFEATVDQVPYELGGAFEFSIDAGAEYAHQMYLILQSASGSYPGFTAGSEKVHIPLEWDAWTDIAFNLNPYWCNFYGILDHEGCALAQMSTFGVLPSETMALSLQHAAVVFVQGTGVKPVYCTNPANVLITKE